MLEVIFFLFKYKIKKDKNNLPQHCLEFFQLKEKSQMRVIDIYFECFGDEADLGMLFNDKQARYYDEGVEVSFFNSYYFCDSLVCNDINNLIFIDKFMIDDDMAEEIIKKSLCIIRREEIKVSVKEFLVYPGILPERLAMSLDFMKYLTELDAYNVKYIKYGDNIKMSQREIIKEAILRIRKRKYKIEEFYVNKKLPEVLLKNIDFLQYMIEEDITCVKYLDERYMNNFVDNDWHRIVRAIITYINSHDCAIELVESNIYLAQYLNKDFEFVNYMIDRCVDNVEFVDWHNIISKDIKRIIDNLALKLVRENIEFDICKYPFRNLFYSNYMFMVYLIGKDARNINYIMLNDRDEVNKIVDIYLNKYKRNTFDVKNYLGSDGYLNPVLVENKHMLSYFIRNNNSIFKYINFKNVSLGNAIVEVILKEASKRDFEFDNDSFLVEGKYPVVLSNSYRFMRFVIDKNFNNLAYMDISMCDKRELKRVINYAFRMVYYIRGDNKGLNFDIDGYFKDSMIIHNDYFQECLRSL